MSINYRKKQLDVRMALASNGALCAISWIKPGNDEGPIPVPGEAVSYQAYGAIFDYAANQVGTQPDSLIRAGDRQLMLPALCEPAGQPMPEPPFGASIVGPDGVTYKVASVKVTGPAGVPVMYDVNVRRS